MELILSVLGVVTALVGALMVGFGIPNNAFGTGNTLIEAGTTAVVGGFLLIGLAVVARQLRAVIEALELRSAGPEPGGIPASPVPLARGRIRTTPAATVPLPPLPPEPVERETASAYQTGASITGSGGAAPLRAGRHVTGSDRLPSGAPPSAPVAKPADKDLADYPEEEPLHLGPVDEPITPDTFAPSHPPELPRKPERSREPEAAWQKEDVKAAPPTDWRGRPVQTRGSRDPAPAPEPAPTHYGGETERVIASRTESTAESVTILKSGVIDGMAYTLYSDGSIEAELPHGTLTFGSIEELRDYLAERE